MVIAAARQLRRQWSAAVLLAGIAILTSCSPSAGDQIGLALARNTTSRDARIRVVGSAGTQDFRIPSGQTVLVDARNLGGVRSVHLLGDRCEEVVSLPFGSPSDEFSLDRVLVVNADGLGIIASPADGSAPPATRDISCSHEP